MSIFVSMKILDAENIRQLDAYTIANEPIVSVDLMERAASAFTHWFCPQFPVGNNQPVWIFCGPGNNGGDGLAVARMLHRELYEVRVFLCQIGQSVSEDYRVNLERLPQVELRQLHEGDTLPVIPERAIVIDALFGSGLNRPIQGYWAQLIGHINEQAGTVVAIDIPSGLFADQPTTGPAIRAHFTATFELPKLAFLFPENQDAVGEWVVLPIGLSIDFMAQAKTNNYLTVKAMIAGHLRRRKKHDHKGVFGHALLVAGSYGKVGAAILAARACLRSGVGLLTIHAPRCAYEILQMAVPEAMMSIDGHRTHFSEVPDLKAYRAIGLGCGLDQRRTVAEAVLQLIKQAAHPLVIDADALNVLAANKEALALLPAGSILTPHPGELIRLFGDTPNSFVRLELLRRKARELNVYIVLKGAYTCIACPDGACYFNTTGNPGMATGGSGDVLTGIITGLLAQGYAPFEAAQTGVYIHGLAGDIAAQALGHEALIAGDIVEYLGKAFTLLQSAQASV